MMKISKAAGNQAHAATWRKQEDPASQTAAMRNARRIVILLLLYVAPSALQFLILLPLQFTSPVTVGPCWTPVSASRRRLGSWADADAWPCHARRPARQRRDLRRFFNTSFAASNWPTSCNVFPLIQEYRPLKTMCSGEADGNGRVHKMKHEIRIAFMACWILAFWNTIHIHTHTHPHAHAHAQTHTHAHARTHTHIWFSQSDGFYSPSFTFPWPFLDISLTFHLHSILAIMPQLRVNRCTSISVQSIGDLILMGHDLEYHDFQYILSIPFPFLVVTISIISSWLA